MGSISFVKPTAGKVSLAILIFLLIEAFFLICSPLEYETQGSVGSRIGFHTNYTCGIVSQGIGKLFGSAWTNPSTISYWYLYLPFAYLLSCIVIKVTKSKSVS
ncbi:hypothetical protein A2617_03175 [Candidatus Daviesbacteria bacterium RIFOXYD1_FULL_41_10]|uniref:Uncharacterized protein n=1 Tax=Candidatus Daviesbacteria bacterium RIFOXYD1_FULL_41_10 TaxID=1797801 RepID=A0A1F5MZU8_9BACT|nr:MAG: hypothetical protein A2617_03175 [Candidatus Daviesbacteria bacterium RIFOXYD1_FULL_41_10]